MENDKFIFAVVDDLLSHIEIYHDSIQEEIVAMLYLMVKAKKARKDIKKIKLTLKKS